MSTSFSSVSLSLPENPPGSKLPPTIDQEFVQDEGVWPAFNKAMHAAFGEKSNGLKIEECGNRLTGTLKVIQWCLKGLEKMGDRGSSQLVAIWLEELKNAADAVNGKLSIIKHLS